MSIVLVSMMKKTLIFSIIILMVVIQGCIAIPIPVPEKEVISGKEIKGENVAFIKTGATTREEVIEKLGKPYSIIEDIRVISYKWEMLSAYVPWIIGGGYSASGGVLSVPSPKVFFVQFDENEHVIQFEIITQSPLETIRESAIRWVEKHPETSSHKRPEEYSALLIPRDKAMICVYRPGGFTDAPLLHAPAVFLDDTDNLLAELRKSTYVTAIVPTGIHSITVDSLPGSPRKYFSVQGEHITTLTIDVSAGRIYYIKLRITHGFGELKPILTLLSEEEAMSVLKELKYIGNLTK
ncbi:hypothetical protein [Syntrophus aciditrophicus]|uniref:Hypothetical membrane protein n=1 Tax=Syntrophus aciditrophicus (strain SB) TaxID=56780 RepID=Q2LS25_SYNAS|nr:hypothetical protein [Syntrophus aciditrophicus]ABC76885.1 hypothetical membrane protein [Syntrophus aciditrophicus SB]